MPENRAHELWVLLNLYKLLVNFRAPSFSPLRKGFRAMPGALFIRSMTSGAAALDSSEYQFATTLFCTV